MKTNIRAGAFETNSSSTHSLVMAERSVFSKWERGELLYCDHFPHSSEHEEELSKLRKPDSDFYTPDEVRAIEEVAGRKLTGEAWGYFITYEEFEDTDLEISSYCYKTPGGEIIDALAKYGYDG